MIKANKTLFSSQVVIHNPIEKCDNFFKCGIAAVVKCEGINECGFKVYAVYKDKHIILQERYCYI